jgi:hypothetical protein
LARHLEVEAGWSEVAERSGGAVGIGRREVGDGADMWAPLGGDRGRRRHLRVAPCEKGNAFLPIRHCRAGRDGWAELGRGDGWLGPASRPRPVGKEQAGWAESKERK